MCEVNAYLLEGQTKRLVLESVEVVASEQTGLRLVNIFGEQKFINARFHAFSLVDRQIILIA
jgi:predicted RNA-binding protein